MAAEKHPGMSSLARELTGRMQKEAGNLFESAFDFGIIQGDMSLLCDHFPKKIPEGEYLVTRHLTNGKEDDVLTKTQYPGKPNSGKHVHGPNGGHAQYTGSGIHSHPDTSETEHVHDVLVPRNMADLLPGDRVLVAWVFDYAVAVDVIPDDQ